MLKLTVMQGEITSLEKTRVCFVITKGLWGGAQKYVYNLATQLPKERYEVSAIIGKGEPLKERFAEKNIRVINVESLGRDISVLSEIKSLFKLFWAIRKERPDVLHLNSPKAGGLGSFIGRILGIKKIIYTAHGWTFNEERPVIHNALILIFSWLTILLCHKIIVIAPREEEQAKILPLVNPRKIVLIRNGIENVEFKEKNEARKHLSNIVKDSGFRINDSVPWIGTIAELNKNKGIIYTIEALKNVKNEFQYIILGEGEERTRLDNLVKKYNMEDRIFLVGFVDKANLYLKAFDIFLLSSIKEGLPYVILEAGLAELPVIATSVGGIPDIIDNGKNGILISKTRPGEITKAIEYMMSKPEEREVFGTNLNQKIRDNFSLTQMLDKTERLYLE
ncbi:MAG: glycosyltransferase [Minisyncoccia bacterium]